MPRGGRREGAGRKPKPKLPFTPKNVAAQVLSDPRVQEVELWLSLLADKRTRFQALAYLTDRRDGKAPAVVGVGGIGEDGEVVPSSDSPLINIHFTSAEPKQPEEPRTIEGTLTEPEENPLPVSGKKPDDPALAKAVKEAARTAQRKAEVTETPVSTPPEPEPPPGFVFWPESKIKQHEFHRWKIPANVLPMPRKR